MTTTATKPHVFVRHATVANATASAARLAAKYGPRFAVVQDGVGGTLYPYAVVSYAGL